ncbi:glycosyltransferase family 4 protein [Spirosoma endophyticum]|uniref:Glycosyltransferase involved in cell wall bisynthesis n=1 Tax=Spirosoma endophyticum TaxID=662367 RepID=A0A1I2FQL7_9BACT|nr:glycosyltransferase family 4 protein [Spirosoma endophyticum]SFF07764.1 Glycosyltransferase involved in cell wall bisynthesis [Spirosoma endophyticum]
MNDSPKILFLLHLPPPVHGSSLVGLTIKNSIAINKSFKCFYINLLASKQVAETGKINLRKILGYLNTFSQLLIFLLKERPIYCYLALTTTGVAFYKDLILVALLKFFRVKLVYHLHNKGINIQKHKFVNRICYQYIFKNAVVIILSKYLYFDIQGLVPIRETYICHNGVEDENRDFNLENSKKDIDLNVKILFLSNLIESKGVLILLKALVLLKRKNIPFLCSFVGGEADISLAKFYLWIEELGLGKYVIFEGKKYGEEKKQAFIKADIFALPTYYHNECFPLVLLEAMSYSLPIVSTYEGGIQDIVEDGVTGFLVRQNHVELLAEKLEILITDSSLRQRMGIESRNKFETNFTLKKFENRFINILQSIVTRN